MIRELIEAFKSGIMSMTEIRAAFGRNEISPNELQEIIDGVKVSDHIPAGTLVEFNADGEAEPVICGSHDQHTVIGIAMGDGLVAVGGQARVQARDDRRRAMMASYTHATIEYASHGYGSQVWMGSQAYNPATRTGIPRTPQPRTHAFKSRFPPEVEKKAWELLKQHMSADQHFAFMEGTMVELVSKDGKYRLLIVKNGDFNLLQGKSGEGISQAKGTIRSYKYPLGDEIAAFIDWFRFKTPELIENWNCGTYGIVKEGERR